MHTASDLLHLRSLSVRQGVQAGGGGGVPFTYHESQGRIPHLPPPTSPLPNLPPPAFHTPPVPNVLLLPRPEAKEEEEEEEEEDGPSGSRRSRRRPSPCRSRSRRRRRSRRLGLGLLSCGIRRRRPLPSPASPFSRPPTTREPQGGDCGLLRRCLPLRRIVGLPSRRRWILLRPRERRRGRRSRRRSSRSPPQPDSQVHLLLVVVVVVVLCCCCCCCCCCRRGHVAVLLLLPGPAGICLRSRKRRRWWGGQRPVRHDAQDAPLPDRGPEVHPLRGQSHDSRAGQGHHQRESLQALLPSPIAAGRGGERHHRWQRRRSEDSPAVQRGGDGEQVQRRWVVPPRGWGIRCDGDRDGEGCSCSCSSRRRRRRRRRRIQQQARSQATGRDPAGVGGKHTDRTWNGFRDAIGSGEGRDRRPRSEIGGGGRCGTGLAGVGRRVTDRRGRRRGGTRDAIGGEGRDRSEGRGRDERRRGRGGDLRQGCRTGRSPGPIAAPRTRRSASSAVSASGTRRGQGRDGSAPPSAPARLGAPSGGCPSRLGGRGRRRGGAHTGRPGEGPTGILRVRVLAPVVPEVRA